MTYPTKKSLKVEPKPLYVAIRLSVLTALAMLGSTQLVSASGTSTTTKQTTQQAQATAKQAQQSAASAPASTKGGLSSNLSGMTDDQVKSFYQKTGVLPGTAIMPWPSNLTTVTTRYGGFRWRGGAPGFHGGLDIVGGSPQLKITDNNSFVLNSGVIGGGGGNTVTIQRKHGDWYTYMHLRNPSPLRNGQSVSLGQLAGIEGMSGGTSSGVHLHLGYGISNPAEASRRRNYWLGVSPSKSLFAPSKFIRQGEGGKLTTDPTPYYNSDLPISEKSIQYYNWLGGSIRQQFNTLYGANLPVNQSYARPITRTIPALGVFNTNYEWTPEKLAAARASIVEGGVVGDMTGYSGAFNQGGMSYQVLASFISSSDGLDFGTLPQPALPPDIEHMSVNQIVDQIDSQRYGNVEWEKAAMKLSSKGMLNEYLFMTATENFIRHKNKELKKRVNGLIAAFTSAKLYEYNKKIEAIKVMADAEVVPGIIDLQLSDLGYDGSIESGDASQAGSVIDINSLPNDIKALTQALLDTISQGESSAGPKGYNAYNSGSSKGSCSKPAGGMYNFSTMTLREIANLRYAGGCKGIFAAGKYQIIPDTRLGRIQAGVVGWNTLYTPEAQEKMAMSLLMARIGKFVKYGTGSVSDAQYNLSKEWASIAIPPSYKSRYGRYIGPASCPNGKKGVSFYQGNGNNAAFCTMTNNLTAVLTKIKQVHSGGQ